MSAEEAAAVAEVSEETTDFCGNLGDFGTELTEFGQELTNFDTLDVAAVDKDVNQVMEELQKAWGDLKASAPEDVDTGALEEAADELEHAFRSAAEDADMSMSRRELVAAMAGSLDLFNSECNTANFGRPG